MEEVYSGIKRSSLEKMASVYNSAHLKKLAKQLGVRSDWHEPDEQGVSAKVSGKTFDNSGVASEIEVTLYKDGKPIASINLASLFAMATGGM